MAKRTPQERFAAEQAAQAKGMAGALANAKNRATAAKPGEVKIATPNGYVPVSQWDFGYGKGVTSPTGAPLTNTAPYNGTAAAAAGSNPALEAQYNVATGNNQTTYNNTLAGIQNSEQLTVNDIFGWKPSDTAGMYDDKGFLDIGKVEAAGVDPSNPFSKMALLTRAYQQGQAGTKNGYANAGHIFSGAYGRAKTSLAFNNDQSKNDLLLGFQGALNSFKQSRLGAGDALSTGNTTAAGNRLNSYLTGS